MSVQPDFRIFADGVDVTAGLSKHKAGITVTDNAGSEADTLNLKISDINGRIATPDKGTKLTVFLGYRGSGLYPMGTFSVDDVKSTGGENGLWLNITAKSVDMSKRLKEKRTKNYHDKTLKDILSDEAGQHGLDLFISPELAGIKLEFQAKTNQSILAFGSQLAKKYDAVFKIAQGKMIFAKRQEGKKLTGGDMPIIPIAWGHNLLDWDIDITKVRAKHSKVEAKHYDAAKAKDVIETEGDGDGATFRLNAHYQDADEAKSAAQAKSKELERGTGGGSFTIDGSPLAMAETIAYAVGTRDGVNGRWFVKTAVHSMGDGQAYKTALTVEKEAKK